MNVYIVLPTRLAYHATCDAADASVARDAPFSRRLADRYLEDTLMTIDYEQPTIGVASTRVKNFGRFLEAAADKPRFFFVGRGKSGTTWLAQIARLHPGVAWKGERKMFERTEPYEPLLSPFLKGNWIENWLQYSSFRVEVKADALRPELARLLHDYLMFRALSAHKTNLGTVSHFGDKIALTNEEDAVFVIKSLHALFPGCKVVHIMRDGRDVAVSELYHTYRNAKSAGVNNKMTEAVEKRMENGRGRVFSDEGLREAAHSWGSVVNALESHGPQIYGDRFLSLRYEEMLDDRTSGIDRLFGFLGLDYTRGQLDDIADATSFETMTKGRASGEQDISSFYRKGMAGDWREHFSPEDRQLYNQLVGELLVRYGYESDSSWIRG